MYDHILIPIDGSPCSDAVIREGLGLAQTYNATVTFLYAVEDPVVEIYGVPYGKQLHKDLLEKGKRTLWRALERAKAAHVTAKSVLVDKRHPAEAILDAERQHDLTVMGTHGRRGVRRLMVGSVTGEVLRRSGHPHLVVRCADAETDEKGEAQRSSAGATP